MKGTGILQAATGGKSNPSCQRNFYHLSIFNDARKLFSVSFDISFFLTPILARKLSFRREFFKMIKNLLCLDGRIKKSTLLSGTDLGF